MREKSKFCEERRSERQREIESMADYPWSGINFDSHGQDEVIIEEF